MLAQSILHSPVRIRSSYHSPNLNWRRGSLITSKDMGIESNISIDKIETPSFVANKKAENMIKMKRQRLCLVISTLLSNKDDKLNLYKQAAKCVKNSKLYNISSKKEISIPRQISPCKPAELGLHKIWRLSANRFEKMTSK